MIPRFYHDKNDGECKQFYYGGCGGNNNNYETMEDCRNKCMAKRNGGKIDQDGGLCKLPAAVGDCRAAIPRWYYNEASNICEEFIWGGCDGNDNNFASKSKCESRCKPMPVDPNKERIGKITSGLDSSTKSTTTNEICTLPEDGGRCRAVMERYRFDPEIHKCVVFQYGGCGGNENNFEYIEECEKTCI